MSRFITIRRPILLLAALISVSAAKAQFNVRDIHLGAKIGLNFSGFTSDVDLFDKNSPGYSSSYYVGSQRYVRLTVLAGVTADYALNQKFSLAAELLYNGRGGAYQIENDNVIMTDQNGDQQTAYDTYNYIINYIELPFLLQYKLPIQDEKTSYLIYGGISPALRVKTGTNYTYYTGGGSSDNLDTKTESGRLNYVSAYNVSPVIGFQFGTKSSPQLQFLGDIRLEYSPLPVFTKSRANGANLQTTMWTGILAFGVRF